MARIQLRRGLTEAAISGSSVIPAIGEPVVAISTGRIKVGNGTDPLSVLPWTGGGSGTALTAYTQVSSLSDYPTTFPPALGTSGSTAAAGNDSRLSDARTPLSHNHTASQISDSTTVGRAVLSAADAAAARTAIGAGTGTSSLALGTTSSTAKAGDYQPAAANISDSTTVGRSVLTAASAAAARTAIGAGTSSLAVGTASTDAMAGNYAPTLADVPAGYTHSITYAVANAAANRAAITSRTDISIYVNGGTAPISWLAATDLQFLEG